MEKIRLGLIGCGNMMKVHAKAVHACTEALEITAVCDVVRENAEVVAEVLGDPFVCTDYRELVDMVDAVLIALPHDLHFECGLYFAGHKKHILMEKPLCNTEEECLKLIEYCEEMGVVLMCAYPVRYWPGIVKLKELIDSGEYGKAFMMSVWTEQYTSRPLGHWLTTARLGGGQFFSHGCHYVDLLLWFFGQPVSGTHTGSNLGTEWMLREGSSAVTIKFANGTIAYHGATWGARGTRLGYDFQVHTEKGLLDYDHHAGTITFFAKEAPHNPGEPSRNVKEVIWNQGSGTKVTNNEIDHFVDCVLNGKKPLTSGRTALESLRVIWKIYEAEKNGTVADLRDINANSFL